MFLQRFIRENNDVIDIYKNEMVQKFAQYIINVALEGCGCTGQAKRYHKPLKETKSGFKGCLPFVPFFDPNFVKRGGYI
jgi:hypothetical protein